MIELSVERIASRPQDYDHALRDRVLARELLALRRTIDALTDELPLNLGNRLRALERSHPAKGDDYQEWQRIQDANIARAERAERERDDLKDALDELCGPDVESRHDAREYLIHSVSSVVKRARKDRDAARADADRLTEKNASLASDYVRMRESLERYGAHHGTCNWWTRNTANCTCGLQAALDSAGTETKETT